MERILATVLKKNNKKLFLSLLSLLLIVAVLSIYSWITPRTTTLQPDDRTPEIETTYTYKAMIKPNVLYPNGGTIEVGDTLYKKITTAIPFDLKTVINAEEEVLVKGIYDVQLLIKAEDIWEKAFPLQNKQSFEQRGTDISVIDNSYQIDLDQVKSFILQVEDETGIRHSQYELEVVPTIQGEIQYADRVRDFDIQDKLEFDYFSEEIQLASDKRFTTAIQFNDTQTIVNSFSILGFSLPLIPVRITSTTLFVLLLLSILFSLVYLDEGPVKKAVKPEAERLNKKYGRRLIRISQQINFEGKTIVPFETFKSMLKIADEIEQPIFFYENGNDHSQLYLIVDVVCVYMYEPRTAETPAVPNKGTGHGNAYVVS